MFYKWFHFYHAIPNQWKRIIKTTNDSCTNGIYLSHHLIKNKRIDSIEKIHSKEIYWLLFCQNMSPPTSQQYFKTLFSHLNLDWKLIYVLARILTKNTSLRAFQYNVMNNVSYFNHKFFQFKVSTISLCSYCNQYDETVQHLFNNCNEVLPLGTEIKLCFVNDIKLIALWPQSAILDSANTDDRYFITLLILKFYVYKPRGSANMSFAAFFHELIKNKTLEKNTALRNRRKLDVYKMKWSF